jgi:integrase
MSRRSKGTRIWLEPEERNAQGRLVRRSAWVIRDGAHKVRTGCAGEDREGAEQALASYIASKYRPCRDHGRDPSRILVLDVLNIYLSDKACKHARPDETKQRILTLADFWQPFSLADVNGPRCREYIRWRVGKPWKSSKPEKTHRPPRLVTDAAARRELEDLRAAINYYRKEGLCSQVVSVVLPDKSEARDVWINRSEAARMLLAAWRARQTMDGKRTQRAIGKHLARFLLVGLYTGTRHTAICAASFQPAIGRGHLDLDRGVFYRRPKGSRLTKKRQPPVKLPDRLLAHLRRWQRLGIAKHAVVEWNGKPIKSVRTAFTSAVKAAGIEKHVTAHTLRHTSATWVMQNGADPWQAAGFLGMSVETLINNYGHHHPDFQADAARAASGQKRDRNPVNKTRSNEPNATIIAEFSKRAG